MVVTQLLVLVSPRARRPEENKGPHKPLSHWKVPDANPLKAALGMSVLDHHRQEKTWNTGDKVEGAPEPWGSQGFAVCGSSNLSG